MAAVAADTDTARFGAVPGALGTAVGCATTVGPGTSVAVAAPGVTGITADTLPADESGLGALLARCRLTLVSLDSLPGAGELPAGPGLIGAAPAARALALQTVDQSVDRLRAAAGRLPGGTLLLLLGISEAGDGPPQLHVAIAAGPGFSTPEWLTSASTNRSPFVQLIDVAPTALRALGLTAPPSMNGQPMRAVGSRPGLLPTLARLGRLSTAAGVHYASTGTFFWSVDLVVALVVALGVLAVGDLRLGRGPRGRRSPAAERLRRAVRAFALLAAALPVATVLANLLPWEATNTPGAALTGAVVAADVVVAAAAGLGPWRRSRLGAPIAVLTLTAASLAVDAVTGSHLELDGMLGYDAIVAGRFTGFGGLALGVFLPAALLLSALGAARLGRRARPQRARLVLAGTVTLVGVLVVALIGAPSAGQKFGGVLAAVPAFLVLGMLLTHIRVTALRLLVTLTVGVLTVSVVVVLDWLKPATQRSHLGRFADQILTGQAWTVVTRKAHSNLDILVGSPIVWLLPVAFAAAWWLLRPGGRLRDGVTLRLPAGDVAVLRDGLVASALSLSIAAVVEDSGVAVPAAGAAMLVPLLVWLAAAPRDPSAVNDDRVDRAQPEGATAFSTA
ncbi:MAG TPA: hypothetical protein VGN28_09485 [Blastococcus sp.]|nr:hypothetical protein [Blastococcus sp.]